MIQSSNSIQIHDHGGPPIYVHGLNWNGALAVTVANDIASIDASGVFSTDVYVGSPLLGNGILLQTTGDAEYWFGGILGFSVLGGFAEVANDPTTARHVAPKAYVDTLRDPAYFKMSQRYYAAGADNGMNAGFSTLAGTLNTIRAIPVIVNRVTTIDQVAIRVTTAAGAGGKARIGLYANDDATLLPTTLIQDFGEVDTTTTGDKIITVSRTLQPGVVYWFAINFGTSAATCRSISIGNMHPILGMTTLDATNGAGGWTVASTYGAMPANFPASPTVFASTFIAVFFRVA